MPTLRELSHYHLKLQEVLEQPELSEIDKQAALDTLEGLGLENKLDACCHIIAEQNAMVDNLAIEIRRLQERKQMFTRVKQRVRDLIEDALVDSKNSKIKTMQHTISVRESSKTIIDFKKLEENKCAFLVFKTDIDESATKKAIKNADIEVDGIEKLITKVLTIR
tara:strand:- start:461 stop:955 length:495 start_codon:yes stop_codon:yes gene_type:complete